MNKSIDNSIDNYSIDNSIDNSKAGKCLEMSLADVTRHRDRKLVMGPAGNSWDTAHFWTEDSKGKVYDRAGNVPRGYAYKGRTVNPESVRKELENASSLITILLITLLITL